jgi:hypothetical protein
MTAEFTKNLRKKRFSTVLEEFTTEEDCLARYPAPVLLLEPYEEGKHGTVDTPEPMAATMADAAVTAQQVFTGAAAGLVHPNARVDCLGKSKRNPFEGLVTLGRARNNDIILSSATVSKLHAIFRYVDGQWFVQDKNSTNGVYIDGVRIPPGEERAVNDGARLRFGTAITARFFEPESFWAFCSMMRPR